MAEAVVCAVVDELVSAGADWLKGEISLLKNVESKLKNMEIKMKMIQGVLEDAENQSEKKDIVKDWLKQLKEVSYDMDDVLDEWSTRVHMLEREMAEEVTCFSLKKLNCLSSVKQLPWRRDIASRIEYIDGTIMLLCSNMKNLKLVPKAVESDAINKISNDSARDTTSQVDVTKVHNRDEEKNFLLRKVFSMNTEQEKSPQVISIVGTGGLGKTTLAQMIYNDGEVKQKFGTKRVWVCVSNPFDEVKVAKDILEGLKVDHAKMTSLQTLHQSIVENLSGVSFLLVLDDVWNETPNKWEKLEICLSRGKPDSIILVTTRKVEVASMMGTTQSNILRPRLISDSDCWVLMSQIVFQGRTNMRNDDLEAIGKDIAKRCKGLPLAAKTLGSLLRSKVSVAKWTAILGSEIWELEKVQVDLFPHIFLSYQDLPAMLKHCFLILAIFPKDTKLKVEEIIDLWMDHGLLNPRTKKDDMVNTCKENLTFLVERALLDDTEYKVISMHDIIHDFALYLLGDEVFSINAPDKIENESGSTSTSKNGLRPKSIMTRHLYIKLYIGGKIDPTSVGSVEKLRTCMMHRVPGNVTFDLVKGLKMVRTLYLVKCDLRHLPESIGELIHLRSLHLREFFLVKLPETIGDLYNLQQLDVEDTSISTLPDSIGKLTNLTLLRFDYRVMEKFPESLGKLMNLHTVSNYVQVGARRCRLELLKDLNQIRGDLRIRFHTDYDDEVDAKKAALGKKGHITKLQLAFEHEVTDGVIAALQPHSNLQQLTILALPPSCRVLPGWITSLHHLTFLRVLKAPNISTLPPLGELQSLETLWLNGFDALKIIGREFWGHKNDEVPVAFPSLLKLNIYDCKLLEEWSDIRSEDEGKVTVMPKLQRLEISECKKLGALPSRVLCRAASLEMLHCRYNNEALEEYLKNDKQLLGRLKNVYINHKPYSASVGRI